MDHMDYVYVALGTLAGVLVLEFLVFYLLAGARLDRLGAAWGAFRAVLGDRAVADKVFAVLHAPPPEPPKPVKRSAEPLRLVALLQREGRVLDFFLEDISQATDEQVGAGVRELHRKAQTVIKDHLVLEPVLPQHEGDTVEVPAGFDPSAIQLTGNVTGNPPFRGTLQHHGWRVKDYKLPSPPEGQDEFVIAPAEVDLP
jgi:Domain of unknown function (DUF2760)